MKKTLVFVIVSILASCAPHRETVQPTPHAVPPSSTQVIAPPPVIRGEPAPVPKRYRKGLACEENTASVFNQSGLEILPFMRLFFFDMDNDGTQELIVGSKDGSLRMLRKLDKGVSPWTEVSGYFQGIQVGAFSSPAVADLDLDGTPEIIVGSGGFSPESGRILVFRNTGSPEKPVWQKVDMPVIDVGDDATPTVIDSNGDSKPDLIVGNSTGALMLYRNTTVRGNISFSRAPDFFKGINIGLYGIPAATMRQNRMIIIAGNSMGKLYLIERPNGSSSWQRNTLAMEFSHFAAPAFMQNRGESEPTLIVSDGNGQVHYYRNVSTDFRSWQEAPAFIAGRLMPGPVCSPVLCELDGKSFMVTGNINGELKLFEPRLSAKELPWVEKTNFFRGIKLSGYARGTLVMWQGKYLLITGQQDGYVRAFLNVGTEDRPTWKEQKDFFRGVPKTLHASPAVFDLDGDGMWELIVGDVDGNVAAYRVAKAESDRQHWTTVERVFSGVTVDRYASPSLVRHDDRIYLFVGQQNGAVHFYSAEDTRKGMPVFSRDALLSRLEFRAHSSPSVSINKGVIDLSVGDYNGNLRHFACRSDLAEIP